MYIKLSFVVLLAVYHFSCQKIMNDLFKEKVVWTSFGLRIWNEAATLFLVVIVFLVEMKNTMDLNCIFVSHMTFIVQYRVINCTVLYFNSLFGKIKYPTMLKCIHWVYKYFFKYIWIITK